MINSKFQIWIDARERYHLSHVHIQMARELSLNPKHFGKIANHKQEKWKLPLDMFIEELYFKHFKRTGPERVTSLEDMAREYERKRVEGR